MSAGCYSYSLFIGYHIDAVRQKAGTDSVVDVDHPHAEGARIEHGEEWGDSAKVGPIADARRDCNDGAVDQSTDYAWKRPIHTGHHYHHPSL